MSRRVLTMRRRIIGIVVGLILALGTVSGLGLPVTAAYASTYEICDIGFACLNAWNGGPYVNTYGPAVSNDNFELQPIDDRCKSGSDLTTTNCPYSGVPAGLLIVQIRYLNTGNCLGDFNGESGDARAGAFDACNNPSTGSGGSDGTVFFEYNVVVDDQATCPPGHFELYSFHWQNGGLGYPGAGNDEPWYVNSEPLDCVEQAPFN
jgi:hypothetical protein